MGLDHKHLMLQLTLVFPSFLGVLREKLPLLVRCILYGHHFMIFMLLCQNTVNAKGALTVGTKSLNLLETVNFAKRCRLRRGRAILEIGGEYDIDILVLVYLCLLLHIREKRRCVVKLLEEICGERAILLNLVTLIYLIKKLGYHGDRLIVTFFGW